MEDFEKTMAPRRAHAAVEADFLTMPGMHDSKPDGRFSVGDLVMNRYKVLAELGQGGMGVVYKCFDETAGIEVALKALPPELSHNTLEMEDIKDNFQLVHNLHHPNIASSNTLEKDSLNGNYYLIMECCEGEDLRRWLRQKRREGEIKLEDILPIISQIADALDYAHEMKIIHRDIKPGNIMIDQFGKIKVLDFGLAAQIHTSMTRVSMAYHGTSGTGPYMAPEQWEGRAQDARADQYALAVVAYEMLAGHLPFESTDAAVLREAVLKSEVIPLENIPQYANVAIKRALSKNPAERFGNCSDFAAALAGKKVKNSKTTQNGGFPKWAAVLIVAVFVIGAGIAFFGSGNLKVDTTVASETQLVSQSGGDRNVTDEQLDSENATLKVELRNKIAEIKQKNYDTDQTFGQKINEMKNAFEAAQETKMLINANKKYKEAKELADWILSNGELYETVKKLRDQAKNNRSDAEKYEPQIYAEKLYKSAVNAYSQAEKFYKDAKFAESKQNFEDAVRMFAQVKNTAFDNKLQYLTAEAKKAENAAKWDEVKSWAEKIRPLDSWLANRFVHNADKEFEAAALEKVLASARNAKAEDNWDKVEEYAVAALKIDRYCREAQNLKLEAKNKLKAAALEKVLASARNAKAEGDWEKVQHYAVAALKIDYSCREAQNLKLEAKPTLEIIATVDDRRVPATVNFGDQREETLNNILRDLRENRSYKGSLSYKDDDAEYIGNIEFTCDWLGPKKITVVLEKVGFNEGIVTFANGVKLEMVKVDPGAFTMSKRDGENYDNEVEHQKTLIKAFYIGKYEVTQEQWQTIMGTSVSELRDKANSSWPLRGEGNKYPIYYVSWKNAMEFCKKMNEYAPDGWRFTLPTETQWEFAACGGKKSRGYKYSGGNRIDSVAWYISNSGSDTHEVGGKIPNELGLYDMSGNVWEWCLDNLESESDDSDAEFIRDYDDTDTSLRVCRGGSWGGPARSCRSASRIGYSPAYRGNFLGLRVALVQEDGFSEKSSSTSSSQEYTQLFDSFTLEGGVKLEMVKVEPGSFTMSKRDRESFSSEIGHQKTLTKAFYIGKYEVTQEQWRALMGTSVREQRDKVNRSWSLNAEGNKYPIYYVSWREAMEFCEKMNEYAPDGWRFTLPTETQWEFAARGGNKGRGYKYSGRHSVASVAWYKSNSKGTTHIVGKKAPNELGVYDMSGNVWEWCLDNWENESNKTSAEFLRDYRDTDGSERVGRGGSIVDDAQFCRSGFRNSWVPYESVGNLGFRVALVQEDDSSETEVSDKKRHLQMQKNLHQIRRLEVLKRQHSISQYDFNAGVKKEAEEILEADADSDFAKKIMAEACISTAEMTINLFKQGACPYQVFTKTVKENLDELDKIYPNHRKGGELRKEFNRLIKEHNSR